VIEGQSLTKGPFGISWQILGIWRSFTPAGYFSRAFR
jgi:hypothetical protein